MQEQGLFSADEHQVNLSKPRFGDEEKRRARPVMPLSEGEVQHAGLNRGPHVAFRSRTWRSSSRNLIVASALVLAATVVTSIALYAHFTRVSPTVTTQPTTQAEAVAEPTPVPQSPAPSPEPSRKRRATVVYVPLSDQEDHEDNESEGKHKGKRHSRHEDKGDHEKKDKRGGKLKRVDIKVRH